MSTDLDNLIGRVQRYENYTTPEAAVSCTRRRFDMLQIKYDGWWARVVVASEVASIYSRQGELKDTFPAPGVADMILIGEYLKGTNRSVSESSQADVFGLVMVFDALHLPGHADWLNKPYEDRHNTLVNARAADLLPEWCRVVMTWSPEMAATVWKNDVVEGGAEGLVFRRSSDTYVDAVIGRVKQQFTMDYLIGDYQEGAGKRKGMAGALVGFLKVPSLTFAEAAAIRAKFFKKCPPNAWKEPARSKFVPKLVIGGGFTDAEMIDQFTNFDKYAGRVLEVTGWQIFESGAMRHPNAKRGPDGKIRWRDDKSPEDCVWHC